jgi:hypothetical protein
VSCAKDSGEYQDETKEPDYGKGGVVLMDKDFKRRITA